MSTKIIEKKSVVIRFTGDSGDGMQLTGTLFSDTSAALGNSVATFPDFPSEIRAPQGTIAGVSGFQVHFGTDSVNTPGDYCDVLVAMNPAAFKANLKWAKRDATIILDQDAFTPQNLEKAGFKTDNPVAELKAEGYNTLFAPITTLTKAALEGSGLDNKDILRCKNMFALGVCYYLFNFPVTTTEHYYTKKFAKKPHLIDANKKVLQAGVDYGANTHAFANTYTVQSAAVKKGKYRMISGNVATAWGFIAAAEKAGLPLYCGSYPITPATVILEELSRHRNLNVTTLQCEDEIAGICTSIGASFAGSLAVTTTSGPGLALKSEAIGLAIMAELPLVIVNVQRGGPSTGLPTKTEQADLVQALYGRNGESPLVVLAANSPSQCFDMAFEAARIALENMTPVILLTDGYIANGAEPWLIPSMQNYPKIKTQLVGENLEKYLPYQRQVETLARNWAVPGMKNYEHRIGGLEKDSLKGSVSHDPVNHQVMVNTRAEKVKRVADCIPPLNVMGAQEGDVLLVGWGGTYGHLLSAFQELTADTTLKIGLAHFNYINPLPKNTEAVFSLYKKIIVSEINNGQFATYLRSQYPQFEYFGCTKTEGLPFTVEELVTKINKIIK